jgi:ATP-dependent DNA helicase PIF1
MYYAANTITQNDGSVNDLAWCGKIDRMTQQTTTKQFQWDAQAERALDLMENSNDHLFITGQAGTGKTTLIEGFRKTTKKNVIVLAPTGVAAANIGGRTIHSFCGIGPSSNMNKAKPLHERDPHKEVVEHLDMVIIDEASMVRADLLDFFDKFLRVNRDEPKRAFGGVQIVFVGDLYQLSPVVNRDEASMFSKVYPTPYFFSAHIFTEISFKFVELDIVHRQKDSDFLKLLQSIRVNAASQQELKLLNNRTIDDSLNDLEDFTVYLSTTNAIADKVNMYKLGNVHGEEKLFQGIPYGDTSGFQFPAEMDLRLKVGAQVMMLNNDKNGRWVNGTVGKFLGVFKDAKKTVKDANGEEFEEEVGELLMVELEDGTTQYIARNKWDVIDYIWDEDDNAVETDVVGGYSQYPVKLAWAITIHKSQGKTFDNVVIDLGRGAFAHGQLYVALSRCRTLEGIELVREANMSDIRMDARVVEFLDICRKFGERNVMMGVVGGLF